MVSVLVILLPEFQVNPTPLVPIFSARYVYKSYDF